MSLAAAARSMNTAIDELLATSALAMPRVFLSYARADRDSVETIAALLASNGFSAWWDDKILPGEDFAERIVAAIVEAHAVVVLWSQESIRSPWVRYEAHQGLKRGKLVPVATPGLDLRDIRPPFNDLDTLSLGDDTGLVQTLKRLEPRTR